MAGRNVPFFTALTVDALGTGTFVPLSLLYFATATAGHSRAAGAGTAALRRAR